MKTYKPQNATHLQFVADLKFYPSSWASLNFRKISTYRFKVSAYLSLKLMHIMYLFVYRQENRILLNITSTHPILYTLSDKNSSDKISVSQYFYHRVEIVSNLCEEYFCPTKFVQKFGWAGRNSCFCSALDVFSIFRCFRQKQQITAWRWLRHLQKIYWQFRNFCTQIYQIETSNFVNGFPDRIYQT